MKQLIAICLVLSCLLCGCGGAEVPTEAEEQQGSAPGSAVIQAWGPVVADENAVYYWRYNQGSFEETSGYMNGQFPFRDSPTNELIRRDQEGVETVLTTGLGRGDLALTEEGLYLALGDSLMRMTPDYPVHAGEGAPVYAEGNTVVSQAGDRILVLANAEQTEVGIGQYLAAFGGRVYYYTQPELSLCSVGLDGSEPLTLWTADGAASMGKIAFTEDRVYFSYGVLAGTGLIFQGGQCLSVKPDGSDLREECDLQNAGFLLDGHTVLTEGPTTFCTYFYEEDRHSILEDGTAYWMEPVTGDALPLFQPEETEGMSMGWCRRIGDHCFGLFFEASVDDPNMVRPQYQLKRAVMLYKDLKDGHCETWFDTSVIRSQEVEVSDELVSDVFAWEPQTMPRGDYPYTFHIPQINLEGAAQVNQEIYDLLYPIAQDSIADFSAHSDEELIDSLSGGMSYEWSVSSGVLSLTVKDQSYPAMSPRLDVHTYAVDSTTGELLSNEELPERFGVTEEDISVALGHACLNDVQDGVLESYHNDVLWCFHETMNMDNQKNIRFFLDKDGDLCCSFTRFWIAGSSQYTDTCKLTNYPESPHFEEFINE